MRGPNLRETLQRSLKLYLSASRLALGQSLGQNRWLAAAGVAGAMSFMLLGTGLTALVAPYASIETAALTADDTPQIVALDTDGHDAPGAVARIALRPADIAGAAKTAEMSAPSQSSSPEAASPEAASRETASLEAPATANPAPADATPATEDNARLAAAPSGPQEVRTKVAINDGETLMQVLTDAGADRVDAYHAIAALRPLFSPTKLRVGQKISLTFLTDESGNEEAPSKLLTAISLQPDIDRAIEINRADDGSYSSNEIEKELTRGYAHAKGTIKSSLYLDAQQAGIPAAIIVEMIRMFSYSIDFQREIHPGDGFEVFFDRQFDEDGKPVRSGNVEYASLTIEGKTHRLWRYKMASGDWDYFDEQGRSMKKFLMKTPVDGARISSGFGMRKHPILGFTKFHEGVDFAAPKGTPIYAAGSGKVEIAGWVNGYGNFVRLKHANGYETGYGHMTGFARGIHPGVAVHQGEVIGYVGSTGRSTGPHLHYEISYHGKKINPLGVKVPAGTQLAGGDLKKYQGARQKIMTQMAEAPLLTTVAQATTPGSKAN